MPFITAGPFFSIDVDITQKRALQSSTSIAPRSLPINFTRNDYVYGNVRMWKQSGLQNPPLYRVQANASALALTDGLSQIICNSTNLALIGTGDESDPRLEFYMSILGTVLDGLLNATGNQSINAFLEINLLFPAPVGQQQHEIAIREPCNIFKSGIYPSQ